MKTKLSDMMKFFWNLIPTWFFKFQILSLSHIQCPQPCWTYKLFEIRVCSQQVKWTIWNRNEMYIPLKGPDSSSGMTSEHQQNLQCSGPRGKMTNSTGHKQGISYSSLPSHFELPMLIKQPVTLYYRHISSLFWISWLTVPKEWILKVMLFPIICDTSATCPTHQSKTASRDLNSVSHLLI